MTDFNAMAAVTTTLQYILQGTPASEGISHDVAGAHVITEPPDIVSGQKPADSLNVFLYHVAPNLGYRNQDLPARNSNGDLITKPRLALNLYYLLTAYAADDKSLTAQQILASAMRILHEHPVLTRDVINLATTSISWSGESLADQIELVKLSLQPLTLEEMNKLWTSFFQTSYRISVAYEATVVLIDATQEPKTALPVTKRLLTVIPFQRPMIEEIDPQIVGYTPGAAEVTIRGLNLKADGMFVRFGSTSQPCLTDSSHLSPTQITIAVPAGLSAANPKGLKVGIMPVQVIQPLQIGSPATAHNGFESNVVALMLAPMIDQPSTTPPPLPAPSQLWFTAKHGGALPLNVSFEPAVSQDQNVSLLIGDYTLPLSQSDLGGTFPSSSLSVVLPNDVPTGNLLLRLQVDGIESLPLVDSDPTSTTYDQIIGPFVQVT
jgi:hypothetical protein